MKKSMISFIVSFITICSISIPVFAISSEEITFNGYKWGTSYNEIFENEIDSSMEDGIDYAYQDNSLFVYQNVAGYYCFATYQFDDDEKLSKGCYVLKEEHTNTLKYYDDYMDLVNKLESIYGKADKSIETWKSDIFKDKPNDKGLAIMIGDLEINNYWEDKQGNCILARTYGDNLKCNTILLYESVSAKGKSHLNTEGL